MKKFVFHMACTATLALSGCANGVIITQDMADSGEIATKDTVVADFSSLSVAGPFNVEYVQDASATPSVSISISDNLLPYVEVESKGGKLSLSFKDGRAPMKIGENKVVVTSRLLNDIRMVGPGDLTAKTITAPSMDVGIIGSGDVLISELAVDDGITATITGSGDMALPSVRALSFKSTVTGSGDLTAGGTFGDTKIGVSGSGDIDLEGKAKKVTLKVTGSGDIRLAGSAESVAAGVSGSGIIDITALDCADKVTKGVTGSGKVRM